MTKLAKKTTKTKKPGPQVRRKTRATIPAKQTAVASPDEKRLARNAALRAWRSANRDKVDSYMRSWRAKKAAKGNEASTQTVVGEGAGNGSRPQPKSESSS